MHITSHFHFEIKFKNSHLNFSISSMSTGTDSHEGTPQGVQGMTKSQSTGQISKTSTAYQIAHSTSMSGQFSQAGQNKNEQQNRNMLQSKTGPRITAVKPQLKPTGQHATSFEDPLPQQLLNVQRDSDRDSDTSHSSTLSIPKSGSESGVYSVRERKIKRQAGPVKATKPHAMVQANSNRNNTGNLQRSDSVDNALSTDENGRIYDIYATLPKKGSRREQAMKAEQARQQKSKDVEVYLDYLNRQKASANANQSQVNNVDDIDNLPPPPPELLEGIHQRMDSNVSSDSQNDTKTNSMDIRTLLVKDMMNRQGVEGVHQTQPDIIRLGQQMQGKQPMLDKKKKPPPPPVRRSSLNPDETKQSNEQVKHPLSGQTPMRVNSEGSKFESGAKSNQAQLGRQISAPAPSGYYHYHDPAALGIQASVPAQGRHGPNVNVPNSVSQQRIAARNPSIPVMQADGRYSNATSQTLDSRQQSHYAPCGQSLVNPGQGQRQQGQDQYVPQGQGQYVQHPNQSSQRQQLDTRWNIINNKTAPGKMIESEL
jgi:hypothetical protein